MGDIQIRPPPNILATTNTTATMSFMSPSLDEMCNDVVISYPPVTFGIDVESAETSLPGFPIVSIIHLFIEPVLHYVTPFELIAWSLLP